MYKSQEATGVAWAMDRGKDQHLSPDCAGSLVQWMEEGGLPAVWAVVCGSQACARGGGLAHAVTQPAGISTVRNSACTYSYLLVQQPVGVEMRQHNPRCISPSLAASSCLCHVGSVSGQDLPSPGFLPTVLELSHAGPCP